MKIADRKHSIKSASIWVVTPDLHLTVNVWTEDPKTYFLGEPIFIENSNDLLEKFDIGFTTPSIDLMDSTILENDIDLHFYDLNVKFNDSKLFEISNVKIDGKTRNNEKLSIDTRIGFSGFEIWKTDNYIEIQEDFENRLQIAGKRYEIEDDKVNGIIYLKIKN